MATKQKADEKIRHSPSKDHKKNKSSSPECSPTFHKRAPFLVPSPVITRRTRTTSQSRLASEAPLESGVCKYFCRDKGHGFITPNNPDLGGDIFVHISDIESEFVLKEGDRVTFRTIAIPPKEQAKQAVEVNIIEARGQHKKWDESN
ncbi:calcium-regulated heat-stable protein 1 [Nematostella vectensis]|uniref:calcium-regulated heat-stable protein 1 n=1 Tax=Nematostella vectensis TaxID=45351 RepID=UPI0013904932|nr:calcium-regulated heat-stable protein 1 [Nematostella vectensis]